jgi:hypothetical protein
LPPAFPPSITLALPRPATFFSSRALSLSLSLLSLSLSLPLLALLSLLSLLSAAPEDALEAPPALT